MQLDLRLQPKQYELLDLCEASGATWIGYGGARGGGKSAAARRVMLIRRRAAALLPPPRAPPYPIHVAPDASQRSSSSYCFGCSLRSSCIGSYPLNHDAQLIAVFRAQLHRLALWI